MPSIEETTKAQFAKIFVQGDWTLFKSVADHHFECAARLLRRDVLWCPDDLRLLSRNIEKRLLIGIGMELLLKAIWLKEGYTINKPARGAAGVPRLPFTHGQAVAAGVALEAADTYGLNDLISNIHRVPSIGALGALEPGLRIAKVFRNKEGHVVVRQHKFDPNEYREIELTLVGLYLRGFNQTLRVTISMAPNQVPVWQIM